MSGYWDALERSARGLAGSAGPRPRALFEDEFAAPLEALEEIESDADARPAVAPPPATAAEPPARVLEQAPQSTLEESAGVKIELVPTPASAAVAAEPSDDRPLPPPLAEPQRSAAPGDGGVVKEGAPAAPRLIEVREVESRTIIERLIEEKTESEARPALDAAEPLLAALAPAEPDRSPVFAISEAVPAIPAEPQIEEHAEPEAEAAAPPVIVEIESIEVRIESPAPAPIRPASASRREPAFAPSLHDYLAARSGATR